MPKGKEFCDRIKMIGYIIAYRENENGNGNNSDYWLGIGLGEINGGTSVPEQIAKDLDYLVLHRGVIEDCIQLEEIDKRVWMANRTGKIDLKGL